MKIRMKGYIGLLAMALWLFVTGGVGLLRAEVPFVLVVNAENKMESISLQDTELIFLSKKRLWRNEEDIRVVINENPQIYSSFSYSVLRKTPRQYLIFRKKMLFRGQGMPPPAVGSDQEVVDFVASNENGIGFVSPESVTPKVKVVQITP